MTDALVVSGLTKTFGGQRALVDAALAIAPGETRALAGENGCGKSTLIKILAGIYEPEPGGSVSVAGVPMVLGQAGGGDAAGLRFVHQDLGLVGTLDTVDNLALGHGYRFRRLGRIAWREEARAARAALAELGYDIDVRRPVGELTMSERTAVAVARALSPRRSPARVLVLDEPTANLPAAEAERLFALVRTVSASGVAVLFVSHKFDEIFDLADTVTVLRNGQVIDTRRVETLTEEDLVELVIGHALPTRAVDRTETGLRPDIVLQVQGVAGHTVAGVDLDVRAGEVVGVAGITGSGREELAALLFGGRARQGDVLVAGQRVPPQRPDRAIALGMGLVPAERHANAAFLSASLRENVTVVDAGRHVVRGMLRTRRERSDVVTWLQRLGVRPGHPEQALIELSGGNQQKVVLARWLRQAPKVLILDEPTQGVDVGAKEEIHQLIDEAAAEGMAVLVASSDHDELARLCQRVIVLRNGRAADHLDLTELTAARITASTVGTSQLESA
ncbi:sugar ABC transporter ATP-binding protein [Nocardioides sp. AN3]